MAKNIEKTNKRCAETAYRVQRVARICGVSARTVYRTIAGDTENEDVFTTYMELQERDRCVVQQVEKLYPSYTQKNQN